MKKILPVYILLLFLSFNLQAQPDPVISYVIPDIGSPGMNTYMEIIGPYNSNGGFLSDGIYLNNESDNVVVKVLNQSDTSKIVFGPSIVSWDGRMISTQVFVKPHVNPNSEDWRNLQPEFKIPFRVIIKRSSRLFSNVDTFYIVKPFRFGDISGLSDRVLGQGNLGIRSRRGAMIVDSIKFANAVYTVSTNDCDPYVQGNQGYLPFILISKGNIIGDANTQINVDAGVGVLQNAGPGGGGGGGRFCDGSLINPIIGDDGGNGFTGGGPGGRNASAGGTNAYKNIGTGTAAGGYSLNDVAPPFGAWYESSGGGTGHPFGVSGVGCGNGDNCYPDGGYGGGSGYRQNQPGGGGGFASPGDNSNASSITGGKHHGTFMCVPIAGGSGGASGNPQQIHECSGSGGGGGGAIRLFGRTISNVSLSAKGANGGNSNYGKGGAGSGGMVDISAKLTVSNSSLSVNGGSGGGSGYSKFEALDLTNINYPADVSGYVNKFRGISTDTSYQVLKNFVLRGSKNDAVPDVHIYIKPESGLWQLDTSFIDINGATGWSRDFKLSGDDSLYYLVAVHGLKDWHEPPEFKQLKYTFSQASANILSIPKKPEIDGDSLIKMRITDCPGAFVIDSALIFNKGNAILWLDFPKANFIKNNQGFQFAENYPLTGVNPKDTFYVKIKFSYQKGQKGKITDTLLIPHNDLVTPNKPWKIVLEVDIDSIVFRSYNIILTQDIDTLDFGKICINSEKIIDYKIKNESKIPIDLQNPYSSDNQVFQPFISDNKTLLQDSAINVSVRFRAVRQGQNLGKVYVKSAQCDSIIDSIYVKGFVIYTETENLSNTLIKIDTLDFGKVCIGDTKKKNFIIRNLSNDRITLQNFISTNTTEFTSILEGKQTLNISDTSLASVTFTPTLEGFFAGRIKYNIVECPGYENSIFIIGYGVKSLISFSGSGNFGNVRVGSKDTIELILRNDGDGDAFINDLPTLPTPFKIINSMPPVPTLLKKNDELRITVEFSPDKEGVSTTTLTVFSKMINGGCSDSAKIIISGVGSSSQVQINSDSVYFGRVLWCQNVQDSIEIINTGTNFFRLIKPARIEGIDKDNFTIALEPPDTVFPGESRWYYVRFWGNAGTDGFKYAELVIRTDDLNKPEIRIKLTGYKEAINISFAPPEMDFGGVPIGVKMDKLLTLTNNGTFRRRINDVKTNNPAFNVTPLVADLIPGGTADFIVSFTPAFLGEDRTVVTFYFDTPCKDSVKYNMKGIGIEGNIAYTGFINYSILSPCEEVIDSVIIRNTGKPSVTVNGMKIQGNDANLFSFVNNVNFPVQLDSGETLTRYILFNPKFSNDGVKSAEILTEVNLNSIIKEFKTILTGERKNTYTINPNSIDFGNQIVGTTKTTDITIKNIGTRSFYLKNAYILRQPQIFSVSSNPANIPIISGGTRLLNVGFSPVEIIRYQDSLVLLIEYPTCIDTAYVPLFGSGKPQLNMTLILPELIVDPTTKNLTIPVTGKLNNITDSLDNMRLTADISFNANLFYPKMLSKGKIQFINENSGIKTINIKIDSLKLTGVEGVITEIVGDALLGDIDSTGLFWMKINWEPQGYIMNTDTVNGKLVSIICKEGGKRLIEQRNKTVFQIYPNPVENLLSLEITGMEKGFYKAEIIDLRGRIIAERTWLNDNFSNVELKENLTKTNNIIHLSFDLSNEPSGMYNIIIKTPGRIYTKEFLKIR